MSNPFHEEILKFVENKKGELKMQVMKLTNAKNPAKLLKLADINKYYHTLLEGYDPRDILITAQPPDGNVVTLKQFKHTNDDLKHCDENYYSSKPKEVKNRMQGVYYSVTVTIMMIDRKDKYKK